MREIVERLQEQRKIEKTERWKKGENLDEAKSLKEGLYEEFWDLYDSGPDVTEELESIMDQIGLGDEEPDREQIEQIMEIYKEKHGSTKAVTTESVMEKLVELAQGISGVRRVTSFEQDQMMTTNKGFTVYLDNGKEMQFSLLGSHR